MFASGLPHELLEIATESFGGIGRRLVVLAAPCPPDEKGGSPGVRELRTRSRRRRGGRRDLGGYSIAYRLARAGLRDVVVLERRELASGNTPQAAGLVGQLRSCELMVRSIRHVVDRLEHWGRRRGRKAGSERVGSLKLALTDGRVRELEEHVCNAR